MFRQCIRIFMSEQINEYVRSHNILCAVQLGFIKGRSCMTALTDVVENLRADLDNNMTSILVSLDHSKAFDTVNHSILLKKPEKLLYISKTACTFISYRSISDCLL